MASRDFKVGDLVSCTDEGYYTITDVGVECIVTALDEDNPDLMVVVPTGPHQADYESDDGFIVEKHLFDRVFKKVTKSGKNKIKGLLDSL